MRLRNLNALADDVRGQDLGAEANVLEMLARFERETGAPAYAIHVHPETKLPYTAIGGVRVWRTPLVPRVNIAFAVSEEDHWQVFVRPDEESCGEVVPIGLPAYVPVVLLERDDAKGHLIFGIDASNSPPLPLETFHGLPSTAEVRDRVIATQTAILEEGTKAKLVAAGLPASVAAGLVADIGQEMVRDAATRLADNLLYGTPLVVDDTPGWNASASTWAEAEALQAAVNEAGAKIESRDSKAWSDPPSSNADRDWDDTP